MSSSNLDEDQRREDSAAAPRSAADSAPDLDVLGVENPDLLRRSHSINLYRLFLLELILIYFGFLVVVFAELIQLVWRFSISPWEARPATAMRLVLLFASVYLIWQIGRRFWQGIVGLVTNRYDRAPEAEVGTRLSVDDYPEFYEFVAAVGQRVAAPAPDEIRISHEPECFVAELRQFGIRTQRQLILVLGMPHLSVLSVNELRVILAHELAHFTGGDTTLGVFDYRFVETLRRALLDMRQGRFCWISPVYWYCKAFHRLFVFLSGPIQRHQELRADGLSAAAFGGQLAIDTLLNEWLLARQFEAAVVTFPFDDSEGPNATFRDVYSWFASRWRQFSTAGHEYLQRRLAEEERPSILDSHPTIQARIEAMRTYPEAPDNDSRPARALIPQFSQLAAELHNEIFSQTTDSAVESPIDRSPHISYSMLQPSHYRTLDTLAEANILGIHIQTPAFSEK